MPGDAMSVPPRPLDRRLTAEQSETIVMAYAGGTAQKVLAAQHGISDRSVKRLVSKARRSGAVLRNRAT
jgi:DNA-binding transcriptional regulator LsrR (DeoR family)